MRKVFTRLFSVPDGDRKWWSTIMWWELRRIPYNLAVGIIGFANLASFAYINDVLLKPYLPFEERDWEPFSVLIFAFGANLFYTGGWVAEVLVRSVSKKNSRHFGPIAFALGLTFSVLLTFLPPVVDGIRWIWLATHKGS
jgi:hypothetical protein